MLTAPAAAATVPGGVRSLAGPRPNSAFSIRTKKGQGFGYLLLGNSKLHSIQSAISPARY